MKKIWRGLLPVISIILIASFILAGCSGSSPTSATTSAPTQPGAAQKTLKIGAVFGMTQPMYVEQKKWIDLFVKLKNDQGGWKIGNETYKVEAIVYDSQGDSAKAKNYLQKLVLQDGVKFILGSPTNDPAIDTTVTESEKVVVLGLDTMGNSQDPKLNYYWTPNGMFFARGMMWAVYSDVAKLGVKSYVAVKSDDMMGKMMDAACNTVWAKCAPQVKYQQTVFYQSTTVDFGPIATKIKELNPDVVDCQYTSVTGLFNALYDIGYKGIVLPAQIDPPAIQAVLTHCGKEYMENWEFFLQDPRLYPNQPPEITAYLNAYEKAYGEFQTGGCMWVSYWFVLEDAINNTQSIDPDKIKAYLDKGPHLVRTLTGYNMLFARPEANNMRTVSGAPADFIARMKDGKVVPIRMVSLKEHYLASILSYGLEEPYKKYWAENGYPTFPKDQESSIKFSDLGIQGHD